ncbi:hypothetical protein SAMN05443287_12311 [Micromonospora phaseoli]|uniref:Uncharacterized protein n=1 Tax=Micromonospora phaseoli TaxID=1144548 RepID=A0A1H7DZG8_9ACTN|nr:hypothetical protein CLV64_12016 [Micromonospora phaseoli]SEK06968.1 hypothetical protein SAMN05443287_12311 [Micromonospora phaseoli]
MGTFTMATTTRTRTTDTALTTAEAASALLNCEPAPLVADARPVRAYPTRRCP